MRSHIMKIVAVEVGYWIISISMVFANKHLVGDAKSKVELSLFIAWIQSIVTVLFVIIMRLIKFLMNLALTGTLRFPLGVSQLDNKEILLTSVTLVGMLSFNNLCLKNVGVAFFQVARSPTLLFVVFFSATLLNRTLSYKVFICCLCIAVGFLLGIDQEKATGSFSLIGIVFGVLTSFSAALNGIFTKRALDVTEHDPVQLAFLCNMNASFIFIPMLLLSGQMSAILYSNTLEDLTLWVFLMCTGIIGFAIAWISALQIDLTSPVTHHISANSKAVLQTTIAVVYNKQTKPPLWWVSVLLVVGGALGYAVTRITEELYNQDNVKLPQVISAKVNTNSNKILIV